MSETCIVCLGDLGENANDPPSSILQAVPFPHDDHGRLGSRSTATTPIDDHGDGLIAHLLPCGHNLHNECLKPWVERANSCPICRQSFNQVELSIKPGGPITSSYAVNDRQQIADVDPSMLIEEYDDEEEPEERPCPVCRDDDNEEVLLACDGCDACYHTYCVGLDDIPVGHWFCEDCETQRAIESVCPPTSERPLRRSHNPADRRTRGQQRRHRNRNQVYASNWARVWQSVWDNLNLDLDFPFDDDSDNARADLAQRAESQRREFQQWERRLQVAERQGGANRFRDTAPALLDLRSRREMPEPPEPESREEIRAWNALEKAKEIELDPTPKRKRKSVTASPSETEPTAQPERPLKRPRTRRLPGNIDVSSEAPSASSRSSAAGPSSSRTAPAQNPPSRSAGPSFLQSMLREIETSSAPDESKSQSHSTGQYATGHSSPQTSPGASPTTSNHGSPRPRSTSPPPSTSTRPGSPFSLTSKVEPVFPPPEFSPTMSPPQEPLLTYRQRNVPTTTHTDRRHHSRPRDQQPQDPNANPNSNHNSPLPQPHPNPKPDTIPSSPRASMPFSAKADLQRMVSAALKPHYQSNTLSKDQYTDINRNVSRMLYERVGEAAVGGGKERESWERWACEEVERAVRGISGVEVEEEGE